MIDPHVHARDFDEWKKETLVHAMAAAYRAGLDGFFEVGNTVPALTISGTVQSRMALGDEALELLREAYGEKVNFFHGMYVCLTKEPGQIAEAMELHKAFFPRVVGLKMFAGQSTNDLGIVGFEEQRSVYHQLRALGYEGVLAVHCEKESEMHPELWSHQRPISHTWARPPDSEYESVRDQLFLAEEAEFRGTLEIKHCSVPWALQHVEGLRDQCNFPVRVEVTPHHALLYDTDMERIKHGNLLKMNPPLRPEEMQQEILDTLSQGRFDWIGTDHAPHRFEEKLGEKPPSGIPALPFYPRFVQYLVRNGMSMEMLNGLTHDDIVAAYKLPPDLIKNTRRALRVSEDEMVALAKEYPYDPFENLRLD
jgi:dihydroorotase